MSPTTRWKFRECPTFPRTIRSTISSSSSAKGMPQAPSKPTPSLAQGSGFFISPDGFVVTNNHVVEDAEDITVTLEGGEKYTGQADRLRSAHRRGPDQGRLLQARPFPFVEFSTKDPRVGDWVLAVGNPFGLGGTVTAGIVSAHKRDIGSGPYDYLQIDAAVNRGNSGGPSFDLDGKVVGMNTAIFSPSGGNVGIAFAVPAAPRQGGCRRAPEPRLRRSWLARRRHPERHRRHRRTRSEWPRRRAP